MGGKGIKGGYGKILWGQTLVIPFNADWEKNSWKQSGKAAIVSVGTSYHKSKCHLPVWRQRKQDLVDINICKYFEINFSGHLIFFYKFCCIILFHISGFPGIRWSEYL